MSPDTITNIIATYGAAILAVVGFIATCVKTCKSVSESTAEVKNSTNVKALVEQNEALLKVNQENSRQNEELRKEIHELRREISKGRVE